MIHQELKDWLRKHKINCTGSLLWQQDVPNVGTIHCYAINSKVIYIMEFDKMGGWDVYVPLTDNAGILDTIKAIEDFVNK